MTQNRASFARFRSLLQKWSDKRKKVDKTYAKIGEKASAAVSNPSLVGKLKRWLDQVAHLEKDEAEILSEIGAIERRHSRLRQEKKLRRAEEAPHPVRKTDLDDEEEGPTRSSLWKWVFAFFLLSSSNKAAPKPRDN